MRPTPWRRATAARGEATSGTALAAAERSGRRVRAPALDTVDRRASDPTSQPVPTDRCATRPAGLPTTTRTALRPRVPTGSPRYRRASNTPRVAATLPVTGTTTQRGVSSQLPTRRSRVDTPAQVRSTKPSTPRRATTPVPIKFEGPAVPPATGPATIQTTTSPTSRPRVAPSPWQRTQVARKAADAPARPPTIGVQQPKVGRRLPSTGLELAETPGALSTATPPRPTPLDATGQLQDCDGYSSS